MIGLAALTVCAGVPTFAEEKIGDGAGTVAPPPSQTDAGRSGQVLHAEAGGVVFEGGSAGSGGGSGGSGGALAPVGDWSPPPCWYAPQYTPEQLKEEMEAIWAAESTGYEWDAQQRARYAEGGDEPGTYEDFNMAKSGEGYWWDGYVPEGGAGVPGALDCDEGPFWVDEGEAPPAEYENVVTPQILAELAYNRIRVPDTEVSLKPDAENGQKVNLPTWAWLDEATFQPVSVTARVPVLGMWARTTATPVALRLDPGTEDADLHPSSGVCPINDDGSIGTPYTRGSAEETPPCGVTYRRSTPEGETYPFTATITWEVAWEGSGGTGGDLPDGEFGSSTDLDVDEIQTIVR